MGHEHLTQCDPRAHTYLRECGVVIRDENLERHRKYVPWPAIAVSTFQMSITMGLNPQFTRMDANSADLSWVLYRVSRSDSETTDHIHAQTKTFHPWDLLCRWLVH